MRLKEIQYCVLQNSEATSGSNQILKTSENGPLLCLWSYTDIILMYWEKSPKMTEIFVMSVAAKGVSMHKGICICTYLLKVYLFITLDSIILLWVCIFSLFEKRCFSKLSQPLFILLKRIDITN